MSFGEINSIIKLINVKECYEEIVDSRIESTPEQILTDEIIVNLLPEDKTDEIFSSDFPSVPNFPNPILKLW